MPYKVTKDAAGGSMSIRGGGMFAEAISNAVKTRLPKRILETGTFLGMGTTQAIMNGIIRAGPGYSPDFVTVECNPRHVAIARQNLNGLPVSVKHGLSVPAVLLPDHRKIEERFVYTQPPDGKTLWVDGYVHERAAAYYNETNYLCPDDGIGATLRLWNGCDFALLDSAGHVGYIEFTHLTNLLRLMNCPCVIALDDTDHVKHAASLAHVHRNPTEFTVLDSGHEKFGWCIAEFRPQPIGKSDNGNDGR